MQRVSPVRGRLERAVISRAGAPVYVDYAHTADALEAAIAALRPHVEGPADHRVRRRRRPRPGQAPEMGAVAARLSDVVIVTDDNPRSEDPAQDPRAKCWPERPARSRSPAAAKRSPRRSGSRGPGDIVLLAGKGHEPGQIVGDRVLPFDDALVARECAA